MGFFSWKTSDTNKSIPSEYSDRPTFTVHLITEDGQVFTENNYEGYGVFGDKDFYELIAELNNLTPTKTEDLRNLGLELSFETHIKKGKKSYRQGRTKDCDFFSWETPLEQEGGKTPNQLVEEGWKRVYPNGYGDFSKATKKAKATLKMPKLVEKLPSKENWKEEWDKLPYPKNCKYQGFFY